MTQFLVSDLRELVLAAEEDVLQAWETADQLPDTEELSPDTSANTILDRIAQIGIALTENELTSQLRPVVECLIRLFRAAAGEGHPTSAELHPASKHQTSRWFEVATRIYVIGAISVSDGVFGAVRNLVLQRVRKTGRAGFWLRETLTALARQGNLEGRPLLAQMSEHVADRPVLFRRLHSNKDEVVNSLCQFDFLQCVISREETGDLHACYPNFGAFFKGRAEPIIVDLITDGESRAVIPGVTDEILAKIIRELERSADNEFFSNATWDRSYWDDQRVPEFLARHARTS